MIGGAARSMGKRWLEATGPLPSSGSPNGVNDTPDQSIAHRHVHHTTRTLDLVARVQMFAFAKEHNTDFVGIDVERDAEQIAGKLHQLIKTHTRKTRDRGDANRDARNCSHLTRRHLGRESFQRPAYPRERVVKDGMQVVRRVIQWSAFGAVGTVSTTGFDSGFCPGLAPASLSGLEFASGFDSGLASSCRSSPALFSASRDNPQCSRRPSVRWW